MGLWSLLTGKMRTPKATGRTHDYQGHRCCWGHNIGFFREFKGDRIKASCMIGSGVRVGDDVLLSYDGGRVVCHRVIEVTYKRDPHDMWDATLEKVSAAWVGSARAAQLGGAEA